ncbi:Putative stomatin/prohibitin-family membrane protease subunit YbbK [Alloactinosynnema sp. L-07]|uniref:SPFH domain-containing protein n=1 Tax=Alloactinosynnema sp. L-07 TaxID=1653480 RepID=UPI00065EF06F|nr:SPFH domain-containing protein [Alloactinosynnema sp. L-07]CRK57125.1 Putative stomatin/prohibitin-family membrane protease subunit YbbK [Alloactinosynnema sp. L-07]
MVSATVIVAAVVVLFVLTIVVKSILVIPQAQSAVIERLGRFKGVAEPGLNFLVPFLDRVRARIDLREQVVSFPPQPVITQDNLTVSIDTVIYFQVTDSRRAVYEIANYIVAVEQLTITTLRNVVGGMSLEETLTSRDQINGQLRGVLDEETGRWGIRVARVELKAIDPPPSIQDSMEKQMRADREKRAIILTAEGQREAAIKTAEGQKQSQILSAEGAKQATIMAAEADRQSRILKAQGERAARYLQAQGQAKAIEKVFAAIKAGRPTPEVLAYQYLQTLPQLAQGDANKVWMIPTEFGKSLEGFARMLGAPGEDGVFRYEPPAPEQGLARPEDEDASVADWFDTSTDPRIAEAVAAAEAVARKEVAPPGASSPVAPVSPAAVQALPPAAPVQQGVQTPGQPAMPANLPPGMPQQAQPQQLDSERTQSITPPQWPQGPSGR